MIWDEEMREWVGPEREDERDAYWADDEDGYAMAMFDPNSGEWLDA